MQVTVASAIIPNESAVVIIRLWPAFRFPPLPVCGLKASFFLSINDARFVPITAIYATLPFSRGQSLEPFHMVAVVQACASGGACPRLISPALSLSWAVACPIHFQESSGP